MTIRFNQQKTTILYIGFSIFLSWGCHSSVQQQESRAAVSGYVTLDGEPVKTAQITFMSNEHTPALKARGVITNGTFSILASAGPAIGENSISISPTILEMEEFEQLRKKSTDASPVIVEIPKQYQDLNRSPLKIDVTAVEADNYFEFELKAQ